LRPPPPQNFQWPSLEWVWIVSGMALFKHKRSFCLFQISWHLGIRGNYVKIHGCTSKKIQYCTKVMQTNFAKFWTFCSRAISVKFHQHFTSPENNFLLKWPQYFTISNECSHDIFCRTANFRDTLLSGYAKFCQNINRRYAKNPWHFSDISVKTKVCHFFSKFRLHYFCTVLYTSYLKKVFCLLFKHKRGLCLFPISWYLGIRSTYLKMGVQAKKIIGFIPQADFLSILILAS